MAERQAFFLYRDGKTLYFDVDDQILGFMSDSLSSGEQFQTVVESAGDSDGAIPLSFVSRNAVLITQTEKSVFSESYQQLKVHKTDPPNRTKQFTAGYRLGEERGYARGLAEGLKRSEESRIGEQS